MTESSGAALVRRFHQELFASGDLDRLDDYFADDFVSHNNPPGFPAGIAGVRQFFEMFRAAFDDLSVQIDELLEQDDLVAVATTIRGTHRRELLGFTPTGRSVAVTGVDIVRITEGKIAEHRGLTDTVGLMRQLAGG